MWENYLTCAARLAKPSDVVYALHRLLDIRAAHKGSGGGKPGQGQGQQWSPDVGVLEALVRQVCASMEGGVWGRAVD